MSDPKDELVSPVEAPPADASPDSSDRDTVRLHCFLSLSTPFGHVVEWPLLLQGASRVCLPFPPSLTVFLCFRSPQVSTQCGGHGDVH